MHVTRLISQKALAQPEHDALIRLQFQRADLFQNRTLDMRRQRGRRRWGRLNVQIPQVAKKCFERGFVFNRNGSDRVQTIGTQIDAPATGFICLHSFGKDFNRFLESFIALVVTSQLKDELEIIVNSINARDSARQDGLFRSPARRRFGLGPSWRTEERDKQSARQNELNRLANGVIEERPASECMCQGITIQERVGGTIIELPDLSRHPGLCPRNCPSLDRVAKRAFSVPARTRASMSNQTERTKWFATTPAGLSGR